MKTILNYVVFTILSIVMLTSCQNEEMITNALVKQDTFEANSEVADLMQRVSIKDGSGDNIIDNANCFDIQLPVTVIVNDLEIIVDSQEDFITIEAIFDASDDDDDSTKIIFPITIIMSDFTEVYIDNESEFEEFVDQCHDENEYDDDIECIDFQYPIEFTVFNTQTEMTDRISINDDKEMYEFFENMEDNDLVSIKFPVILILADGSEVSVGNLDQLEQFIHDAVDDCDEDDDYDYNDDDCMHCDQDQIKEVLTSGCNTWYVDELEIYGEDKDSNYEGYFINFYEDGTLMVTYGENEFPGTWEVSGEGMHTKLKLSVTDLPDFNYEWNVYEVKPDHDGKEIKLRFGDNKLDLKNKCDEDDDHNDHECMYCTQDQVREVLATGCNTWYVDELEINGDDLDADYEGYLLNFHEDGTLTITHGYDEYPGTWTLSGEGYNTRLTVEVTGLPHFNYEWEVYEVKPEDGEKEIKLRFGDNKLDLKSKCDETDDSYDNNCMNCTQDQVHELLSFGCNTWYLDKLEVDGYDLGGNYDGYHFNFFNDGTLTVKYGYDEYQGTWMLSEEGYSIYVTIAVSGLPDLNDRWMVYEIKPDQYNKEIKLRKGDNKLEFKSKCDETDDSYDNNCMNCTQDQVHELLSFGCNTWYLDKLEVNGYDLGGNYDGYHFNFFNDGTLTVKYGYDEYQGTWMLSEEGYSIYITIEVSGLPDLNDRWMVYEIKPDQYNKEIKLQKGDNKLEFKSKCDETECYNCDNDYYYELLTQGCNKWYVDKFEVNGYGMDAQYDGYFFYFYNDGTLAVKFSTYEYAGTWHILGNENTKYLRIEVYDLPDFNREWMIYETKPDPDGKELKLSDGYDVLEFKSDCGNSNCYECTQEEAYYVLSQGCNKWMVDALEINGYDLDENYTDYYFYFNGDGSVSVEYNFNTYVGTWSVSGEGYNLILTLYIEGLDNFNAEWYIEELKPQDDKEVHLRSGNNVLKFKGYCG